MTLKGKNILVTGAGGGLGMALVRALLEQGAGKIYAAARGTVALAQMAQQEPRIIPVQLEYHRSRQRGGRRQAVRGCGRIDQ